MSRDRKDIEAGLTKKGFQKEEGDHHHFRYFTEDGRKTRSFTKTSHSMKDLSDDLLDKMAKQCHLTKKQFLELVDCSLKREEYEAMLVALGHVAPPPVQPKQP